jgi:hypothetical protein
MKRSELLLDPRTGKALEQLFSFTPKTIQQLRWIKDLKGLVTEESTKYQEDVKELLGKTNDKKEAEKSIIDYVNQEIDLSGLGRVKFTVTNDCKLEGKLDINVDFIDVLDKLTEVEYEQSEDK